MKSLLYIGHSYHQKTQSTQILLDLFREDYEVDLVLDESWKDDISFDISVISAEYDAVVFFQQIPSPEIFQTLTHPNMIFFPMYDSVILWRYEDWYPYRNIKIFNFSKILHEKLISWGFHSNHLQYFIEPKEFVKETNNKVFFWQRITPISINTVEKLFDGIFVNIHMHKSIDPNQEYIEPTKEQEDKFNITYSTWFDTKEEMQKCIQSNTFYIAPRHAEGIGISFLEAMAMGKIVVSNNEATMNEYIQDKVTGYLFDYNNPKPLDLKNIDTIRKNTYEYIKNGFENWKKRKYEIMDFLEMEHKTFDYSKVPKNKFFSVAKSLGVMHVFFWGIILLRITKQNNITRINLLGVQIVKKIKKNSKNKIYLLGIRVF